MSVFAVIPVKTLLNSKTRLSEILSPQERQILTSTMLEDVSKAVAETSTVHRIVIVSSDSKVQELAGNLGAVHILERKQGLNQAVEQATRWCIQNDAESVLILPADIPLITSNDVNRIVNLGSDEICIVIAPSRNGGTNALLQNPPNLISPSFGPDSFSSHLAEASNRGVAARVYRSQSVAMDIDSPEDLENLLRIEAQTASHRFLKQIGLEARLDVR